MISLFEADLDDDLHTSAIVDMLSQLAASEFGRREPMTDREKLSLIPGLIRFPAKRIFLASYRGSICGLAVCYLQFSTFSSKDMLKIHDLFVLPEYRRQGLGRMLVEFAVKQARDMNCAFVNIEVATDNQAAGALYQKLKFVAWLTPTRFLELRL